MLCSTPRRKPFPLHNRDAYTMVNVSKHCSTWSDFKTVLFIFRVYYLYAQPYLILQHQEKGGKQIAKPTRDFCLVIEGQLLTV